MKELTKKLLWIGLTIIIIKGFFQFEYYYSEPVFGWVIDAETGERLEGVNVEAQWKVRRGSSVEKNDAAYLQRLTTITDKHGFYRFPEWEPKLEFGIGVIPNDIYSNRPILSYLKDGYQRKILHCLSLHHQSPTGIKMVVSCDGKNECCYNDKVKLHKY
jgi:hypothetical protein